MLASIVPRFADSEAAWVDLRRCVQAPDITILRFGAPRIALNCEWGAQTFTENSTTRLRGRMQCPRSCREWAPIHGPNLLIPGAPCHGPGRICVLCDGRLICSHEAAGKYQMRITTDDPFTSLDARGRLKLTPPGFTDRGQTFSVLQCRAQHRHQATKIWRS